MGNNNSTSSSSISSKQFHSKIENSKKTGVLTLTNTKISDIPVSIFSYTNLKSLDLSGNRIIRMLVKKTFYLQNNI